MTRPAIALGTVCLDCRDAHEMARFYSGLLGWEPTLTEPDWVLMRDPGGGAGLSFQAEEAYDARRPCLARGAGSAAEDDPPRRPGHSRGSGG